MSAERMALNAALTTDALGGHTRRATHARAAAEGTTSPQAMIESMPKQDAPAGQIFPTRTT